MKFCDVGSQANLWNQSIPTLLIVVLVLIFLAKLCCMVMGYEY